MNLINYWWDRFLSCGDQRKTCSCHTSWFGDMSVLWCTEDCGKSWCSSNGAAFISVFPWILILCKPFFFSCRLKMRLDVFVQLGLCAAQPASCFRAVQNLSALVSVSPLIHFCSSSTWTPSADSKFRAGSASELHLLCWQVLPVYANRLCEGGQRRISIWFLPYLTFVRVFIASWAETWSFAG